LQPHYPQPEQPVWSLCLGEFRFPNAFLWNFVAEVFDFGCRGGLPGWGTGVPPLAAVHHVPTTGVATSHPFAESEEFWSRRRGRGGLKATASLVSIDKSGHSTS